MSPATSSRPSAIYVYDGDCALCSSGVRTAMKWGSGQELAFVASRSDQGRLICAAHGIDPDAPSDVVYASDGEVLKGSDAVLAIARHLKAPARWLGSLRVIPKGIREPIYRMIADNRYRIGGRSACPTGKCGIRRVR